MVLYPEVTLTIKLESLGGDLEKDRNELRKLVVSKLLKERAGKGTGEDASKYRYNVEILKTRERIYVTRPVPLNKGFDFIIHVENFTFMNGKDNPRHDDIFGDLRNKRGEKHQLFDRLFEAIEKVFHCEDPDDFLSDYGDLNFQAGYSAELLVKVAKWFFVEQDIRYWNWSGRNMFMGKIREIHEGK